MAHGGPSKRKPNNNIDDNNEEDELLPPPDGGWGWVIVIASFLIHIISKYGNYLHVKHNFPLSLRQILLPRALSLSCIETCTHCETIGTFDDFFISIIIMYVCQGWCFCSIRGKSLQFLQFDFKIEFAKYLCREIVTFKGRNWIENVIHICGKYRLFNVIFYQGKEVILAIWISHRKQVAQFQLSTSIPISICLQNFWLLDQEIRAVLWSNKLPA